MFLNKIVTLKMIELGGNIKLAGFDEIDRGALVVVKKMAGNYARQCSEKAGSEVQELVIELKEGDKKSISASLKIKDKEHKSEESDKNLFFCLDKCLSKLVKEL
ncbi:hypothetical protein HYX16_03045 [Candidatus Woesearchaeota archaeon]|nr:hypothetical protein [Candidatus Woesearchaeota archaeon]